MAKKLTNEQIVERVEAEFASSLGTAEGDISIDRARAMRYYLRKLYGNEEEGESKVVTSDVSDVVDGIMPSLLRIFSGSEGNLLAFDPVDMGDEQTAEQESDWVNYVFLKKNPAFEIIFNWMFDALLQKVGYVKAYWDETERVTIERYDGLDDLEVAELLADDELEAIERDERVEDIPDPDTGSPVQTIVHDIKFRRTTKIGQERVENVPPDQMRISVDARSLDLCRPRMVGEERMVTRDELLSIGFDKKKIDKLTKDSESIDSTEKAARYEKSDEKRVAPVNGEDTSQDVFRLREAYIKIDTDGDGRAELKQVFTVDNQLLQIDDVDRQPYHAICPHPIPHKHHGLATAEKVMDNQLITSTLLRQILNNLYRTNQPGHVVWEKALGENTMADLLTRKVGRVARFKRPLGDSYQQDVVPFTAADSFPMLDYFDRSKRERTGISADGEGLSPESLKHVREGVLAGYTDLSKMKIEAIARIFAETGFKSLFLHLHELSLKHRQKEQFFKLRGKWSYINPAAWRTRYDMTVQVGLGVGTRDQNLMHLEALWQKQNDLIDSGGQNLTVTPLNRYNAAAEFVKNANLKDPTKFFTDPGNQLAPPPSDQQQELQQQQMALEQEKLRVQAEKQEIDKGRLQLQNQQQQLQHEREMLKLEEQKQVRIDRFQIENEKLRNALTEMGIEVSQKKMDAVLKRVTAESQAEASYAQAEQARANAAKARAEADAISRVDEGESVRKDKELDAKVMEVQAKVENLRATTRKTEAEIDVLDATIDKLEADTRATQVEADAAERGINEILDDGAESERTE